MNKETKRAASVVEEHSGIGERPSKLQQRLNALAELGDFEREGHHAHDLEKEIDPTKGDVIAHKIEELGKTNDEWYKRARKYSTRKNAREALRLLYPRWPG